jgi:hypothetical protein
MSSNSQLSPITNGLLSLNLSQPGSTNHVTGPPSTTNGENTILVVKFDYAAKESHELDIRKGERLALIDNSKNWWLVRKLDSDQTGYDEFSSSKIQIETS